MRFFLHILSISLLFSCKNRENKSLSFYHWKADASLTSLEKEALSDCNTERVYIHYFDVDTIENNPWEKENIFPEYVIKKIAPLFDEYKIIPTIFITNRVFQSSKLNTPKLVEQITSLIKQITKKHLSQTIDKVQIDCDWSTTTKNQYFEFLSLIQKEFDISCTIRLHQIKFQEKTGTPPVKKGTLMLYNMGDLKNKEQNSIIEAKIVSQYINKNTSYPLSLSIGLPTFSQTVVFNHKNEIKLINSSQRTVLEHDPHFKKQNDLCYEVVKDTLFKGFYLSEGFYLKVEESKQQEVIDSYRTIKNSNLNTFEIILYHLDKNQLSTTDYPLIVQELTH